MLLNLFKNLHICLNLVLITFSALCNSAGKFIKFESTLSRFLSRSKDCTGKVFKQDEKMITGKYRMGNCT